jgi:hypothetical protein
MRIVTAQELESWLTTGEVLEADARGPKVVALNDQLFLKIFHTRRNPILARLQPAAKRFSCNANLLHELGIAAPTVVDQFWIDRRRGLSGCLYQPLPGTSVDTLFRQSPDQLNEILPHLAAFIRSLHEKQLYFRSLHVGNILLLPGGEFGLIDFLDLKRKPLPLSTWHIQRNLRHLTSHLSRHKLKDFPAEELFRLYHMKDTQP